MRLLSWFCAAFLCLACSPARDTNKAAQDKPGDTDPTDAVPQDKDPPETGGVPTGAVSEWLDQRRVVPLKVPAQTKGQGGETGRADGEYHAAEVDMRGKYVIHAPAAAVGKASKMFAFFHGDGGSSLDAVYTVVKEVAEKHGLIGVAMLAPNGASWWKGKGISQSMTFDSFLERHVHQSYNIDTTRLYVAGISGGSTFLGGIWLPMYSYKYPTSAYLLCGGVDNLRDTYEFTDSVLEWTRLLFHFAEGDYLRPQIDRSIEYYKSRGFKHKVTKTSGSAHCGFDAADVVSEAIAQE